MESFESFITVIDEILDTKRKRHITGGILLSVSALFGCLAITVMTIKKEEFKNDEISIDIYNGHYNRGSCIMDSSEE